MIPAPLTKRLHVQFDLAVAFHVVPEVHKKIYSVKLSFKIFVENSRLRRNDSQVVEEAESRVVSLLDSRSVLGSRVVLIVALALMLVSFLLSLVG